MPKGSRHILIGTLRWTRRGYALELDDGGVWRLDIGRGRKVWHHIDRRVVVDAIRSDFDLLDVDRLRSADIIV